MPASGAAVRSIRTPRAASCRARRRVPSGPSAVARPRRCGWPAAASRSAAPRVAEPDGTASWLYVIEVFNPGRLPIIEVRVEWHFQCAVQRRRSGHLDSPANVLHLSTPVLAGGATRPWERRLVMNFAELHFVDAEGMSRTNRWPRGLPKP